MTDDRWLRVDNAVGDAVVGAGLDTHDALSALSALRREHEALRAEVERLRAAADLVVRGWDASDGCDPRYPAGIRAIDEGVAQLEAIAASRARRRERRRPPRPRVDLRIALVRLEDALLLEWGRRHGFPSYQRAMRETIASLCAALRILRAARDGGGR